MQAQVGDAQPTGEPIGLEEPWSVTAQRCRADGNEQPKKHHRPKEKEEADDQDDGD